MKNLKWNQITIGFLIGILAGAIAGGSPFFRNLERRWDNKPPHERMMKRFARHLDLTEQQKNQISTVMEQKRTKMDAVFNEMKPKMDQIRAETSSEIRRFLTPEQQEKFTAMESRMGERFKKRFPPRP